MQAGAQWEMAKKFISDTTRGDRRETNCQWLTLCARCSEWQEESSREKDEEASTERRMKMSIIIFQWGKQNMKSLIHTNQIRFHCGEQWSGSRFGKSGRFGEWRHLGSPGAITYKSCEIKLPKDGRVIVDTRNWLIQANTSEMQGFGPGNSPVRRRNSLKPKPCWKDSNREMFS